jgi:uncharacterized protein YndB with AHSA1/START domain
MKIVLMVLGVLIGLALVVLLVGAILPRDHIAGSSTVLRQPADSVWHTVRDMSGLPNWWTEVLSSRRVADSAGREVWEQKVKGGFEMRLIVTEDTPPHRMVMAIDAAPDAPFGGTWTYDVTPADGGTRVSVTEAGYVNNALYRFMSQFVMGHYATQDKYLRALGTRFGETVEPVHATNSGAAASKK